MSKKSVTLQFSGLNNGHLLKDNSEDPGTFFDSMQGLLMDALPSSKAFTKLLIKAIQNEGSLVFTYEANAALPVKEKEAKKNKKPTQAEKKFKEWTEAKKSNAEPAKEMSQEELSKDIAEGRAAVVLPADRFVPTIRVVDDMNNAIDYNNNTISVNVENCMTSEELLKINIGDLVRNSGLMQSELTRMTGAPKNFLYSLLAKEKVKGPHKFYVTKTRIILTTIVKYLELVNNKKQQVEEIAS